MNIQIKATKMELTPAIRDYIQEKMDMLEKYLNGILVRNCDVEIGLTVGGQHHGKIFFCEVNLNVPKGFLRVRKEEEKIYKAIDKVKDHLERAVIKYKGKKNN